MSANIITLTRIILAVFTLLLCHPGTPGALGRPVLSLRQVLSPRTQGHRLTFVNMICFILIVIEFAIVTETETYPL